MKKIIALTVAMVAATGANAAWKNGFNNDTANGNGELLFFMFDENETNLISGAQDLGIDWDTMVTKVNDTGFSQTWNLSNSVFSNFDGIDTTQVRWGVLAGTWGGLDNPKGVMVTAVEGIDVTGGLTPSQLGSKVGTSAKAALANFTTDVNGLAPDSFANNNATFAGIGSDYNLGDPANLGRFWAQQIPFDMTGSIEEVLTFNLIAKPNSGPTIPQTFAGVWDLDVAAKTLTFSVQTSEVPVPAAAWLMGSALIGLSAVARRRRA